MGVAKQPLHLARAHRSIAGAEIFQGIYLRCGRIDLLERFVCLLNGDSVQGIVLDVLQRLERRSRISVLIDQRAPLYLQVVARQGGMQGVNPCLRALDEFLSPVASALNIIEALAHAGAADEQVGNEAGRAQNHEHHSGCDEHGPRGHILRILPAHGGIRGGARRQDHADGIVIVRQRRPHLVQDAVHAALVINLDVLAHLCAAVHGHTIGLKTYRDDEHIFL